MCVCGILAAISGTLWAATLTEHMDIACLQDESLKLNCSYRLLAAGELSSAVAELNGQVVEGRITTRYPGDADTTAILILIDTSDPARQPVIEKNISHIDALLDVAAPHHRFALATFDTDLYLLAPVGSSNDEVREGAQGIRAKGKTTELYRNVLEAVRMIGKSQADRKVLLIMSDGLAEDYAYHHEDVVPLARDYGVIINSIGYPRSVTKSVALQTIRRLSDETGGIYVQADHIDYSIPPGFFTRMLTALDSGGTLEFDLRPLAKLGDAGTVDLSLGFQTRDQSFLVLAPVVFPQAFGIIHPRDATAVSAGSDSTAASVPTALSYPPLRPAATVPARPRWPWLLVLVVLLVLILAVVVTLFFRIRRSEEESAGATHLNPLAYLIPLGDGETRHAVDKTPWRIGRGRNNDLVLSDHSVSRLHAEIRQNEEGALTLNDLDSLNGVFVNDNRVDSIQLREGDAVDIGDVRLNFTLHDESYADQDATVVLRTHTPV
ncbi:MAG: FHA domain-containing protein [Gammaproteobacteria bacterium]|nr:FHA domain-containing protein [Gammaproteobacteria bacterium]